MGTHARIRVQGGIIDDRMPTSLGLKVPLDEDYLFETEEDIKVLFGYITPTETE